MAGIEIQKGTCFVIGPIDRPGSDVRKLADMILKAVIKPALEPEPLSFKVKRADDDARPGAITDHIINDIQKAEIVVADMTGLNPNAMYELGIAHMALRPTIPIALTGTVLPFDTVQQRTIFVDTMDYDSISAAIGALRSAAGAIRSRDYKPSNPVTQANGAYRMQHSEDPKELAIANLQLQVASLSDKMAEVNRFLSVTRNLSSIQASEIPYIRAGDLVRQPGLTGWKDVAAGTFLSRTASVRNARSPGLAAGLAALIDGQSDSGPDEED